MDTQFSKSRNRDLGQNPLLRVCFRFLLTTTLIHIVIAATGDGFVAFNPSRFSQNIDVADIEAEILAGIGGSTTNVSECAVDGPINCRDPEISSLLMRAAMNQFKDIHFSKFGKAVPGDNGTSCHMAWRFRPKKGKGEDEDPNALYKDYRSFVVARHGNCSVTVLSIGDYHSGENARKRKNKDDAREAVDELLPVVETEESFVGGKYLVYYGGGDRCKCMNQYLWSFSCMLGEAHYLNRTLVMDISVCLSKMHTSSRVDEEGKDFRYYFDFEHLKRMIPLLDQNQFWLEWGKWQEKHGLTLHLVEDFRASSPLQLVDVNDSLIMRKFGCMEPGNYWYRVCEEEEIRSVIKRPWHMLKRSRRLTEIASAIAGRMGFDFDALYVKRRGETQYHGLLQDLGDRFEQGRTLYIAANEEDLALFDPLKGKYSVHFLDEFKDLWDSKSDWSDEMRKLNNGIAVEFDGYMRDSVSREVFMMGKRQFEIGQRT